MLIEFGSQWTLKQLDEFKVFNSLFLYLFDTNESMTILIHCEGNNQVAKATGKAKTNKETTRSTTTRTRSIKGSHLRMLEVLGDGEFLFYTNQRPSTPNLIETIKEFTGRRRMEVNVQLAVVPCCFSVVP